MNYELLPLADEVVGETTSSTKGEIVDNHMCSMICRYGGKSKDWGNLLTIITQ